MTQLDNSSKKKKSGVDAKQSGECIPALLHASLREIKYVTILPDKAIKEALPVDDAASLGSAVAYMTRMRPWNTRMLIPQEKLATHLPWRSPEGAQMRLFWPQAGDLELAMERWSGVDGAGPRTNARQGDSGLHGSLKNGLG